MHKNNPRVVEAQPLRYLLSLPDPDRNMGYLPVLCFLHGHDEAAPLDVHKAITRHGPLRAGNPSLIHRQFIIVAPQLPFPGDIWRQYAQAVMDIVHNIHRSCQGDPERTYLSGFSFGGNGVFDLALMQQDFWAGLWPVDPTRMPEKDPQRPVWMSFGEVSRRCKNGFIQALSLKPAGSHAGGERVYLDQGQDHVGSASFAYRDERIYNWLLSQRLALKK